MTDSQTNTAKCKRKECCECGNWLTFLDDPNKGSCWGCEVTRP